MFNNCSFMENSIGASGTYSGLIVSANTTDFSVTNCVAGGVGMYSTTNPQNYGIEVVAGTSDRYIISQNLVTGNVTGGVSDSGSGVNKSVTANY
jgi:hypothetical protein